LTIPNVIVPFQIDFGTGFCYPLCTDATRPATIVAAISGLVAPDDRQNVEKRGAKAATCHVMPVLAGIM
jgi:hypothetical protein